LGLAPAGGVFVVGATTGDFATSCTTLIGDKTGASVPPSITPTGTSSGESIGVIGGSFGNAGGSVGEAGGSVGEAGGSVGRAGGSVGKAGGSVGRAGGSVGKAGGSAGKAGGSVGTLSLNEHPVDVAKTGQSPAKRLEQSQESNKKLVDVMRENEQLLQYSSI
jgi:hypothetical protein